MGLRYERGNRKATNGPMVFFSILRDEVFEEEIRSAYVSGLSFYAYRFPKDSMMSYGSSEDYIEGIGVPGFVIGRFNPELPLVTIPYRNKVASDFSKEMSCIEGTRYKMPEKSTTREEYSNEVTEIIKAIKDGRGEKVVAARVIVKETDFDIADKFYQLCQRFPDAFVFCFSTPITGCWIGASPELLLEGREGQLKTMALAGTRVAGQDGEWDSKNIEEQEIVVRYLEEVFRKTGLEPEIGERYTKKAGGVEHLCTEVIAQPSQKCNLQRLSEQKNPYLTIEKDKDCFTFENLIKDLSPTPALCGYPKVFGMEEIKKLENFDRGCYGGFCGPFHTSYDFTFHVVLRCASLSEKRQCIYVGGGITAKSIVSPEWDETTMKAASLF